MKFIVFLLCLIGLLFIFSDRIESYDGYDSFSYLLFHVLISLSICVIVFLILFITIKLNKVNLSGFMFIGIGTIFILAITYSIFIANYIHRTYQNPDAIYAYSLNELISGKLPTICTQSLDTYLGKVTNPNHNIDIDSSNIESHGSPYYDDGYVDDSESVADYSNSESYYHESYNSGPGVHEVSSYTRDDGTEVSGYLRTNPDGIEENNFSYHGN